MKLNIKQLRTYQKLGCKTVSDIVIVKRIIKDVLNHDRLNHDAMRDVDDREAYHGANYDECRGY